MRLFSAVILGAFVFSVGAFAQDDNMSSATTALQGVLSNMKDSAIKLAADNHQLVARNNAIQDRISLLEPQLKRLEDQGDVLDAQEDQLQQTDANRAQDVTRLENESFNADNRIQKTAAGISSVQRSLEAGYHEYKKLLLQLKGMAQLLPPPAAAVVPQESSADLLEKEKLKLMKMIYESQQRQESLQGSIFDFQKNAPLPPLTASWDDGQLKQLEDELKDLERNYSQLKDVLAQMIKKAKAHGMTVDQHVEEKKLQGSFNDLKGQRVKLKFQLDDLRTQMVELDKRKSSLEMMIQQLK